MNNYAENQYDIQEYEIYKEKIVSYNTKHQEIAGRQK